MADSSSNNVVITGVGMISPIGIGRSAFWSSLISGTSGVKVREPFDDPNSPLHLAASVDDFNPRDQIKDRKALKKMCREVQLGCAAAALAIEDAGIDPDAVDSDRFGVITGAESFYCTPEDLLDVYVRYEAENGESEKVANGEIDYGIWIAAALRETQPLWMLKYLPNMVSCQIAIALDARGPNDSIFQGDASALLAVNEAAELIRRGVADVMIVGGSGARMNIVGMMYSGVADLCRGVADPQTAVRPFDRNRCGTVAGEAAGMLVLESEQHAAARSANVIARMPATAATCRTAVSDQSDAIYRALDLATTKAELVSVDAIYAHSDGRVEQDAVEAGGIGKYCESSAGEIKVTAPAGAFGNTGAGKAALSLIAGVLGVQEGVIPPTLNFEQPDSACELNLVHGEPVQHLQNQILVTANSRTGQAAAVAITKA